MISYIIFNVLFMNKSWFLIMCYFFQSIIKKKLKCMKQRYVYLFIDRLIVDYMFELGSIVLFKNDIKYE